MRFGAPIFCPRAPPIGTRASRPRLRSIRQRDRAIGARTRHRHSPVSARMAANIRPGNAPGRTPVPILNRHRLLTFQKKPHNKNAAEFPDPWGRRPFQAVGERSRLPAEIFSTETCRASGRHFKSSATKMFSRHRGLRGRPPLRRSVRIRSAPCSFRIAGPCRRRTFPTAFFPSGRRRMDNACP